MQLIAMLSMLLDHLGYIFFPHEDILRGIGRLAFPIYCYGIVQGHIYTSSHRNYSKRLLIIALASQIPFNLSLNPWGLNVIFTLLLGALLLIVIDKVSNTWIWIPIMIISSVAAQFLPLDYNAYGILLILIYRFTRSHAMVLCHLLLNVLFFLVIEFWPIQMLSIVPTLFIAFAPQWVQFLGKKRMPRWLWISFYPLHLLVLAYLKLKLL
ncbi:conjugal transfer protein TraX [Bacillus sp. FJAT-27264]|uniref:TraX family protein n=1 Tax=Paenibacillus sp. (strain DSM 101736 / FJAT-27264) TaxID=1850362 RepID=UPI000807D8B0|nr:TraX family protein [Bacillus sp. FJAT-27264]OBZ15849.1 conjugal transfer protein TraX [Bacillus sp. FJAT-27264]